MPRVYPISKQDHEVADRLKEFRRRCKCTRSYLAEQIGIAPAAITRIELGRVPLKYELARGIFRCLNINPYWAATGKGNPKEYICLPDSTALKAPRDAVFSEVFSNHLTQLFERRKADLESEIGLRYQRGKLAANRIQTWFRDVPDGLVGEFEKHIDKAAHEFFLKYPTESPERVLQRKLWYEDFCKQWELRISAGTQIDENSFLTDKASGDKVGSVKGEWLKLKKQIQQATSDSGSKSKLAKSVRVDLTQLSKWLTDSDSAREPGAEYTLRMLHWVKQHERKQK